ncbi:complement C4-like [Lepisosteus oculatus]|uniref:complement C4-like n=1 Tax=Lepisosteus oculatus TaxID=7918 RepID=UPI0035F528CB
METLLSLLLAVSCAAGTVGAQERFLVSAPSVFHVGVSETVSVQLDPTASSRTVSLYLEDESSKTVVSEKAEIKLGEGNPIGTVSLKVLMEKVEDLKVYNLEVPYLLLVAEMNPGQRKVVRVLLSSRRGYIFIQTNQPVYTPRERVQFRVFTLDHAMRPVSRTVTVSVHNAAGPRRCPWAPLAGPVLSGSVRSAPLTCACLRSDL